jgi:hypothetical protein
MAQFSRISALPSLRGCTVRVMAQDVSAHRNASSTRAFVASVTMLAVFTVCGSACRAPFRLQVEPHDATRPAGELLLEGMNPFLLTDLVSSRVIVEVDHVAGLAVHPAAIEGLRETLEAYLPQGKQIEIRLDDEIPAEAWLSTPGDFLARAQTLGPYVDSADATGESELIYVVYVPDEPEYLGWATRLVLELDGQPRQVDTILMFPAQIDRAAELWITAKKIERAILIHELGHLLGLVSGPGHRELGNPRHCTEPQCVMTHPSARTKTYNALPALVAGRIPHGYCGKCRQDIQTAKELWQQAAATPGYTDQLLRQRQIETLRARACWYGKKRRFAEAAANLRQARELSGEATDSQRPAEPAGTLELLALCPSGEN